MGNNQEPHKYIIEKLILGYFSVMLINNSIDYKIFELYKNIQEPIQLIGESGYIILTAVLIIRKRYFNSAVFIAILTAYIIANGAQESLFLKGMGIAYLIGFLEVLKILGFVEESNIKISENLLDKIILGGVILIEPIIFITMNIVMFELFFSKIVNFLTGCIINI